MSTDIVNDVRALSLNLCVVTADVFRFCILDILHKQFIGLYPQADLCLFLPFDKRREKIVKFVVFSIIQLALEDFITNTCVRYCWETSISTWR